MGKIIPCELGSQGVRTRVPPSGTSVVNLADAMPRPGRARQDMKDIWRERVKSAADAYEKARKEAVAALRRCSERDDASEADFRLLKAAQERESAALNDYMKVLKTFHDLVVDRKPPIE